MPIYFGILAGNPGDKSFNLFSFKIYSKPILKTLLFIAGLSTVFILLGFGAGALGSLIQNDYLPVLTGIIVIILGLHQMELINFPFMQRQKRIDLKKNHYETFLDAYLLGFTFSFGWTPCIGPVLSTILAITLTGNQAFLGSVLMGVYALGLAIPFLILSVFSTTLINKLSFIKPHMNKIKRFGGLLIVIVGILLLFNQVNILTSIFN